MYIAKTDAILNSLWPTAITIQISKIRWPCHKLQQYIIPTAFNTVCGIDVMCFADLQNTGPVTVYQVMLNWYQP